MPFVFTFYNDKNKYLHRMIPLKCIRALAKHIPDADLNPILRLVLSACRDRSSNVRLLAAQTLNDLNLKVKDDVGREVRPVLESMLKDKDDDVKYFASLALKKASLYS